jgi:hypothetical protein
MKRLTIPPLVLLALVALLPVVGAEEPNRTMIPATLQPLAAEVVEVGPPSWYTQILGNPSFERGWTDWEWSGAAQPGFTFPLTGVMNAELCHEQGVISSFSQWYSIAGCRTGPIWYYYCIAVFTGAGRPPHEDYTDVSQGWIADSQNLSYIPLWELWDVDDHGQGYECVYVQVRDSPEVGTDWNIIGACDTNYGGESSTIFILDDLEVWCDTGTHAVYLPVVVSGGR